MTMRDLLFGIALLMAGLMFLARTAGQDARIEWLESRADRIERSLARIERVLAEAEIRAAIAQTIEEHRRP